jgi:hypothetical protein
LQGGGGDIETIGQLASPDGLGVCRHTWKITRVDGTRVRVSRLTSPKSEVTYDYTMTRGLSSLHSLPGASAQFRFSESLSQGDSRLVTWTARPSASLGSLVATVRAMGQEPVLGVFGVGLVDGLSEPYRTFYNLWKDHPLLFYQLGGLVLALIYRTEEARTRDG